MMQLSSTGSLTVSSSVGSDVWHPEKGSNAYEWWYFDALSDDGREGIVVVFLDNFIFSSRGGLRKRGASASTDERTDENRGLRTKIPAVSFLYFRDGRAIYKTVNEYTSADFSASESQPKCRIGDSSFTHQSTTYGSGYSVSLRVPLARGRRLDAAFEWLSVESDYSPDACFYRPHSHCWNLAVPRADVTGKINIFAKRGSILDSIQFRGTGFHDHNIDDRWMPEKITHWQRGRAHFADCTAVFSMFREIGSEASDSRLFIAGDGQLKELEAKCDEQRSVRHRGGIKYPLRTTLTADGGPMLSVRPVKVIDSGFFYLRFLSEMSLLAGGGDQHETIGVSELIEPRFLRYRWLDWINALRRGKNT